MYRIYHAFAFDILLGKKPKIQKEGFELITHAQAEVSKQIQASIDRNGAGPHVECVHKREKKVDYYKIVLVDGQQPMEYWEIKER